MKKLLKIMTAFFFGTILLSCAATRITTFTDPNYRGTSFNQIVVHANLSDLELRNRIETKIVEQFHQRGIKAMKAMEIIPPTRNLSPNEINAIFNENEIDSYLIINVANSGSEQVYIPKTGSSTEVAGDVTTVGNTTTIRGKSKTTEYGGYYVSKPWVAFEAHLYDTKNGQGIWISSAETGGNAYATFKTLINSYCSKIVKQLVRDGIFIEEK